VSGEREVEIKLAHAEGAVDLHRPPTTSQITSLIQSSHNGGRTTYQVGPLLVDEHEEARPVRLLRHPVVLGRLGDLCLRANEVRGAKGSECGALNPVAPSVSNRPNEVGYLAGCCDRVIPAAIQGRNYPAHPRTRSR
jgi:hypothetical protein